MHTFFPDSSCTEDDPEMLFNPRCPISDQGSHHYLFQEKSHLQLVVFQHLSITRVQRSSRPKGGYLIESICQKLQRAFVLFPKLPWEAEQPHSQDSIVCSHSENTNPFHPKQQQSAKKSIYHSLQKFYFISFGKDAPIFNILYFHYDSF